MTDDIQSAEFGGPVPAEAGGPVGPAAVAKTGTAIGRGWRRYRAWRRSRPFWAGIWLIIAGAELLLIPLPIHSMGVILHIGIGGISGILIGAILIALGLLLWFHPVQRMFYSIVAVLLAIAALVASNLGGFLLGTILGIIGASLGFAWMPGRPERRRARRRRLSTGPDEPDDTAINLGPSASEDVCPNSDAADADATVEETGVSASDAAPESVSAFTPAESDWGRLDPSWGAADSGGASAGPRPTAGYAQAGPRHARRHGPSAPRHHIRPHRGTVIGGNVLVGLISLLSFGLINLSPTPSPSQSPDPPAAATPDPSASAAASPSPNPSASPAGSPSPSPTAPPGQGPAASASPTPTPTPTPTGTPPPFAVATAQSTLTASSATLAGFAYDGVVTVPTASGSQQMMEFSATSIDLSGTKLDVAEGGTTMTATASSLDFRGNVILYATQLSGSVGPLSVTITPGNAVATLLQILAQLGLSQSVTQAFPLTLSNVTTQQPYIAANGLTATALLIS